MSLGPLHYLKLRAVHYCSYRTSERNTPVSFRCVNYLLPHPTTTGIDENDRQRRRIQIFFQKNSLIIVHLKQKRRVKREKHTAIVAQPSAV